MPEALPSPSQQTVEQRVARVIRGLLKLPDNFPLPSHARLDDLDIDALDRVELVLDLEDEFHCTIPEDEFSKLESVGGVGIYLETRIQRGTAR